LQVPIVPKQAEVSLPRPAEELKDLYRQLLFLRHYEEKTNFAYRQGKAGGYLHTCIGMEPMAVGWLNVIRKGYDYVITAYRDHGHAIVLGSDPVDVMCEIMGRSGGTSRGKGGSMHLYDAQNGFFGGWGIVGGHTALGGGLAFAAKYRKEDRVTLCYLGDGAANAGLFFETLNMAGLWDLPVIFIIENNLIAMGTRLEYHAADTELHKRGIPFDMKHERVDCMDLIQTMEDAERIVEWVRKHQKPYLVEAMTYRFAGHGAADNNRELYRTKDEEDKAAERDPIKLMEKLLLKHNLMNQEKMEAIDEEVRLEVERIYEQADASPFPEAHEVYDNVYTDLQPEEGH